MIDPRTQYIVYKERENELMLQIERIRTARERGEMTETSQPWYVKTGQWLRAMLKEKAFPRQQIVEEKPC